MEAFPFIYMYVKPQIVNMFFRGFSAQSKEKSVRGDIDTNGNFQQRNKK